MAPDVLKAGKPMMIGGTDPALTHQGNPWLFRCRPNDTYSAKTIFAYGNADHRQEEMGAGALHRRVRRGRQERVHRQPEGSRDRAGAGAGLHQPAGRLHAGGAGGAPVRRRHPVHLLHVRDRSAACSRASCARWACASPGWARRPSPTSARSTLPARRCTARSASPTTRSAQGPPRPPSPRNTAPCARTTRTTRPPGRTTRPRSCATPSTPPAARDPGKVRAAILALKGYAGAEGEYDYDANGDGLHGYNVVRNEGGKIVFDKRIDFPA